MCRALYLHPAIVVFALFVSSLLFGFVGLVVVAVPFAAVLQVLVGRLWVEGMDREGVDPNPPPKPERTPERGPGPLRRTLDVVLGAVKRR